MSERAAEEFERARKVALVKGAGDLLLAVCVATELALRYRAEETVSTEAHFELDEMVNVHEVAEVFRRGFRAESTGDLSPWNSVFREIMTSYLSEYNAVYNEG